MPTMFPYPGLKPFQSDQTDIFFGREAQTDELLRKLSNTRFLAVVGVSGCGKSSLVIAGMISALETGFMVTAGARWRIATMRPGSHPLRRLAEALVEDAAIGSERTGDYALPFLEATLRRGPKGLIEALTETTLPPDTNLLVLVDQFEELFRFRDEENRNEQDAFVALLLETAAQRDIPIYVVVTMRSDYLGDCALFAGLPEALNQSQYLTPRMSREQRREAIIGPARVFGGEVDPSLVNRLLNETGFDPNHLPVLQHLLMRMWASTIPAKKLPQDGFFSADVPAEMLGHVLTESDYDQVGGIAGALSTHADQAFDSLRDEQKPIAEILFKSLCERGDERFDGRRPTPVRTIADRARVSPDQAIEVVEVFRNSAYGFLVPASPEPLFENSVIDITHESLIRLWKRLKTWVEQEGKSAETYRHLEQTAQLWKEGKAALWGTPDLEAALVWKEHERPSLPWAKRYGGDFQLAMEFLEESTKKQRADRASASKRKRRKVHAFFSTLIVLFLMSFSYLIWQIHMREWRATDGVLENLIKMKQEGGKIDAENSLNGIAIHLWNRKNEDNEALDNLLRFSNGIANLWSRKNEDNPCYCRDEALDNLLRILQKANRNGLFAPSYDPDVYQIDEWKRRRMIAEIASSLAAGKSVSTAVNEWDDKSALRPETENQGEEVKTILTIESRHGVEIDAPMVQSLWWELSSYLREDATLPIPATIRVESNSEGEHATRLKVRQLQLSDPIVKTDHVSAQDTLPTQGNEENAEPAAEPPRERSFRIVENPIDIDVDSYEPSEILLSDLNLDPSAMSILSDHKTEWGAREAFKEIEVLHWWWVPRWTIPIWKAANHKYFYPPEAAFAIHALKKLRQNRELVFSDDVVVGVLQLYAKYFPQLVRSACETVGGVEALTRNVRTSLVEGLALSRTEFLLESMAKGGRRQDSNRSNAACDIDRIGLGGEDQSEEIRDLRKETKGAVAEDFSFNDMEVPLRVYIATNLVQYVAPKRVLDKRVGQRLDDLRDKISRKLGVMVPGVRFREKEEMPVNEIVIEIGNQQSMPAIKVEPGKEIDQIMEELEAHLLRMRPVLLSIEEVTRMQDELTPALREWLTQEYTPAELKLIMREVLIRGGSAFDDLSLKVAEEPIQPGNTLAHFPWLIRSLAFWSNVCEQTDYACLGEGLRNIQEAGLRLEQEEAGADKSIPVVAGLPSLEDGPFDKAKQNFGQWLSGRDRQTAIDTFLQEYGKARARVEYNDKILPVCRPEPGEFADYAKVVHDQSEKLSSLPEEDKGRLTVPQRRVLELCQISSQALNLDKPPSPELLQSIDHQLEQAASDLAEWSPKEKYWLTYLALNTYIASTEAENWAPPRRLDQIKDLLFEVVRDLPEAKEREGAFSEINGLCYKPNAGAWCRQMLTHVADARRDSFWIPIELALSSSQLNRQGAQLSLQLLERAERNFDHVEKDREQDAKAWLAYIRGLAHQALGKLGVEGEIDEAIRFYKISISEDGLATGGPGPGPTYSGLADACMRKGNQQEAEKAIEEGKRKASEENLDQFRSPEYDLFLFRGQYEDAVKLLEGKSDEGAMFGRCFSRAFAGKVNAEALNEDIDKYLSTSHDNNDYIRLIYYWKFMRDGKSDKARVLLEERWREINPSYWETLLKADRGAYMRVWREKLIGYYLDKVSEAEISGVLKDSMQFQASPYNNAEVSREGFLCDWYFYDGLLQSVTGVPATRLDRLSDRLKRAVDTKQSAFYEYLIARDMLKRITEGDVFTLREGQ